MEDTEDTEDHNFTFCSSIPFSLMRNGFSVIIRTDSYNLRTACRDQLSPQYIKKPQGAIPAVMVKKQRFI